LIGRVESPQVHNYTVNETRDYAVEAKHFILKIRELAIVICKNEMISDMLQLRFRLPSAGDACNEPTTHKSVDYRAFR
jgi:hypothetical protein